MDKKIQAHVEVMLADVSIASIRSWIRGKGQKITARTRVKLLDQITRLIEKEAVTFAELEDGVIGIEEAGGKVILLLQVAEGVNVAEVKKRVAHDGLPLKQERVLAKGLPSKPTAVYALLSDEVLRVKWNETHQKPKMDLEQNRIVYEDISRIIVLVADLKRGLVEIRYDKPGVIHPHGRSKQDYFEHYAKQVQKILGVALGRSELQGALKKLIEDQPSLVRLHRGGHVNKRNNYFSGSVRKAGFDIRDDEEYQAMKARGGSSWAYMDQSFYWRPDRSNGKLTREVFSHVDAPTSTLRVDADCSDAEVEYAVGTVRQLR